MTQPAGGDCGYRGRPGDGASTRWTQRRYDRAVLIEPGRGKRTDLEIDGRGRLRLVRSGAGYAGRGRFESAPYRSPAGRVQVDWIEQWTAPQRFVKHPANPIYGPAESGPWDTWTNGVSIVPCADGGRYRMYYAGRKGEGIGFAEAPVDDPVTWREHPASPVLRPRADDWEGNLLNQPRVVALTEERWLMFYTGWGFPGAGTTWALGLAESRDGGTTWARCGEDPILERGGPGAPDEGGAVVPSIIRVGDEWWMWYTAARIHPDGHQNIHLCLATSPDCVHWRKHDGNPVLGDDFTDGAPRSVTSRCFVRHEAGVFQMWYSFAKPDYRIRYAESLDGIEWERSPVDPVLVPSPGPAWDDAMVEYPEIQVVDGVYRLWYCGNGFGTVGYAEGRPDARVDVSVRTGEHPEPDHTWGSWRPVRRREVVHLRRNVQIRVDLRTEGVSPAVSALSLCAPPA